MLILLKIFIRQNLYATDLRCELFKSHGGPKIFFWENIQRSKLFYLSKNKPFWIVPIQKQNHRLNFLLKSYFHLDHYNKDYAA